MTNCQSCTNDIKCVSCLVRHNRLDCGYCNLPFEECECWEPEGPLGHNPKYMVVSKEPDEPDH